MACGTTLKHIVANDAIGSSAEHATIFGLAATDRKLVPYGALIATFHTGVGCLVGPSILYFTVRAFTG